MPTHLTEVCRAGSACPAILAHSNDPTSPPAEVYRPEDTNNEGGIIDFLSSAQSLILIAIGVLGIALIASTAWWNRRDVRQEKEEDARAAQPPELPES